MTPKETLKETQKILKMWNDIVEKENKERTEKLNKIQNNKTYALLYLKDNDIAVRYYAELILKG